MRVLRIITLIAPLAVALNVAPGPAYAEHGRGPCRPDIQALCPGITAGPGSFRDCLTKLCPDVSPGPGSFVACLQQAAQSQQYTLSSACEDHLSQIQAKITAWQEACGGDVKTYCSDVTGRRNILKCLHQNRDQLSPTCRDLLAQHHRWRHHHHHPTPTPGAE